jgi:hypothetical protein
VDFQQKLQILTRNVDVGHSQHVWPILMQLDLRHGAGERRTLRVGLFEPKFMRNHSSPNEYYQQVSKTAFKCIKVRFNSQFLDPCVYFLQVFPNPLVRSAELKCLLLILYHILFDTKLF